MTALAEALSRIGYAATTESSRPSVPGAGVRPTIQERAREMLPDYSETSDDELARILIQIDFDRDHILAQLADDDTTGRQRENGWRFRAEKARAYNKAHRRLVQDERDKRLAIAKQQRAAERLAHPSDVPLDEDRDRLARAERTERHRLTLETQQQAKAERQAALAQRERTRGEMFVEAARHVLGKDDMIRIWRRAEEMYPDHTAWTQSK